MRTARWLLVMVAFAAAAGGCGRVYKTEADRFVTLTAGKGYDRGMVVCLSGAGGVTGENDRIRRGLVEGGVECAIEAFEWSSGWILSDQMDITANKEKAGMLARRIERYNREYPGCPVHLIGVSAGTGLVVWAVEDLRLGRRVENVVLVASSLWKGYDLSAALQNVNGRIYNHCSSADMVLAIGVPLVGTVDRKNGISGGLHGFQTPEHATADTHVLYKAKLEQITWSSRDAAWGHIGDHLGGTRPGYVRERIAPLAWAKRPEMKVAAAQEAPVTAVVVAQNQPKLRS